MDMASVTECCISCSRKTYKKLLQWDACGKGEIQNIDVCRRQEVSEEVTFKVRLES